MSCHVGPNLFNQCPLATGGFYSDTEAFVNQGCRQCPNGTFVSIDKAPGKMMGDCNPCPKGNNLLDSVICKAFFFLKAPLSGESSI